MFIDSPWFSSIHIECDRFASISINSHWRSSILSIFNHLVNFYCFSLIWFSSVHVHVLSLCFIDLHLLYRILTIFYCFSFLLSYLFLAFFSSFLPSFFLSLFLPFSVSCPSFILLSSFFLSSFLSFFLSLFLPYFVCFFFLSFSLSCSLSFLLSSFFFLP